MDEANKIHVTKISQTETENIKIPGSQIMKNCYSFGVVEKEGNIT